MAFNPLHTFRKHQKVIFAALTIVCMLTFVLAGSSVTGRGDFMSELMVLFGRGRSTTSVATIYGKTVEPREFVYLREQRKAASDFMELAIRQAQSKITFEIFGPRSQFDPNTKARLKSLGDFWTKAVFQGGEQFLIDQFNIVQADLTKDNRHAQAKLVGDFVAMLQEETQRNLQPIDDLYRDEKVTSSALASRLYFGGSTSALGLLDFMVWRHEADRLGIQLTSADIDAEIKKATFGSLSRNDYEMVLRGLRRQHGGEIAIDISAALAEEFRVRLAQLAILGFDPGSFSRVPALITPYEFYEYYRKNRTRVSIRFLDVPVKAFLKQVTEPPKDSDLQPLFDKYKDVEYSPAKETPGFKLPRRIKVEWVSTSANSDYYRKAVRQWVLAAVAQIPLNPFPLLAEFYSQTRFEQRPELPAWTDPDFTLALFAYKYLQRPASAASIVGQIGGTIATSAVPLAGLDSRQISAISIAAGQQAAAFAKESKELASTVAQVAGGRTPVSCAFLAATPLATPVANAVSVSGLWQYSGTIKQHMPFELVKDRLLHRVEENLASDLVSSSLEKFKQEMEKKRDKHAEAADYAKQQIQQFGWQHGSSKVLHDKFDIANDPDLSPLREAMGSRDDDPKGKQFAESLFTDEMSFIPGQRTEQPKLYTPVKFEGNRATFLRWRIEDQPPKSFKSLAETRAKVEEAWRFEKARQLARDEAYKIAKQAEGTKGAPIPILTEATTKFGGTLYSLDGVSRLKKSPSVRADLGPQYAPFPIPENVIEYPPADFVDKVLGLKDKGDVLVIADSPQSHYFVIALAERYEPNVKDFYQDSATSLQGNPLLLMFQDERRKQYREETMKRLREEDHARLTEDQSLLQSFEERGGTSE
jgi:hypothetical protein